ncbi:MAG: PSD1 and planctomycete cytochrome C domain-containing protein [Pirellulales bacterium]
MVRAVVAVAALVWTACLSGPGLSADAVDDPQALEAFEKKIRPLLAQHCYECHGPDKQESGLRVDRVGSILKGGESGPAIIPGNAAESLLVQAINYGSDFAQMPPDGKLPDEQIALLTAWVASGAPGPRDEADPAVEKPPFDLAGRKQRQWCFQPVVASDPPNVKNKGWAAQPIDRFVLARLEAAGLAPAAPADKATWLRRVSFDLVGLPPTLADLDQFLADDSPTAEQTVVDRLLDSPRFGERWGRHWLDLMRYAETLGHEFDYPIHNAYQYRDYVIRAFNDDVPYDRFILEHVAGDLLPARLNASEGFNESILATGFWFLGEATHAPVDVRADETGRMDNQIDVLTKAFLGLTVACARCHDHKFDAISQRDYYALAGYLKSSRRQDAIIDRDGKIEQAAARLSALRDEGNAILEEILPAGNEPLARSFADYLLAAREVSHGEPLAGDSDPLNPDIVFEDFESAELQGWVADGPAAEKSLARGTANNQMPVSGFAGKQLINTYVGSDGPTGRLTSKEFRIERRFLRFLIGGGAHKDRTCLNLKVDGRVVHSATGRNDERLEPAAWDVSNLRGKLAVLEIVDDHSGGWGHVNVDQIVFSDQSDGVNFRRPVEAVAKERKLDANRLGRFAAALADEAARQPSHPFFVWNALAPDADENALTGHRQQIARQLDERQQAAANAELHSEPFADFHKGDFAGWRSTGQAFGERPTRSGDWDMQTRGQAPVEPGVAHSGQLAARLRGVLRSPSFVIQKPFIDYHLAGKSGQVRVIIDGYVMDVHNGLLFGGISFGVDNQPELAWRRQGGDYSRYVGHRAHIELIDDGDGFIAVDEIRFSDGAGQPETTSKLARQLAGDDRISSRQHLAATYGQQLAQATKAWRAGQADSDQFALVRFAMRYQLFDTESPASQTGGTRLAEVAAKVEAENAALPEPLRAPAIVDGPGIDEWLLLRGNHKTPGETVPRRFLEALDGEDPSSSPHPGSLPEGEGDGGSGRLELAQRLADPANPLTARVEANRLWQHMFGRGLVATVDNFGVLGEKPTHPELLDYLAHRLVQQGWSRKKLLREMALSSTYRQSSDINAEAEQADPRNDLLHRMRVKRLEGEAIRDSVLAVSGRLNLQMHGPGVATYLTPFMEGRGRPGGSGPLDGDGRRSIYLEVRRNFLNPMFLAFDFPIPFNAIGRRTESNVPAQALTMMNDPLVVSQSKLWAERLLAEGPEDASDRVRKMYRTLYARQPADDELQAARDFLDEQSDRHGTGLDDIRPWADLAHVLMNVKEFIFVN